MMNKKKNLKLEITELFMAKAGKKGWDRCFHGTIKREIDEEGNPVVYGKIKVGDGEIIAKAKSQWLLGDKLDEIVLMALDFGLHNNAGRKITILGSPFFLN